MLNFSIPELMLVLVIALVVFGPNKLPEIGKALGNGIKELRVSMTSDQKGETIKTINKDNKV